jgi:hypothetical protein
LSRQKFNHHFDHGPGGGIFGLDIHHICNPSPEAPKRTVLWKHDGLSAPTDQVDCPLASLPIDVKTDCDRLLIGSRKSWTDDRNSRPTEFL